MDQKRYVLIAALGVVLGWGWTPRVEAQVTGDNTLATDVRRNGAGGFEIRGGTRAGSNLFHSFDRFSVPANDTATFHNADSIQRIFSRVTGGSRSQIDGTIRALGSADLFLINPNGIRFGPDARLVLGGSFVGSTAERVRFADGTVFGTANAQDAPQLTVSVPVGLQFGDRAEPILSRAGSLNEFSPPVGGLSLPFGETLALVGGGIAVDGNLSAPGGTLELGGVGPGSEVAIAPAGSGWTLGYDSVAEFRNVRLRNGLGTTSDISPRLGDGSSGDIQLRGRRIGLSGFELSSTNLGASPGGAIDLRASESVELLDGSFVTAATIVDSVTGLPAEGNAGDVSISAPRLRVAGFSAVSTATGSTPADGGDIVIRAAESVELADGILFADTTKAEDGSFPTLTEGDAGRIDIATGRLRLTDGAAIRVRTVSDGSGGNIDIRASESIEVAGSNDFGDNSQINAEAGDGAFPGFERLATGAGGSLLLQTPLLHVADGGRISSSTVVGSSGDAGTIAIDAGRVTVTGAGSAIASSTAGTFPDGTPTTGDGGLLEIDANRIDVGNGGAIATSTSDGSQGDAGMLRLNGNRITVSGIGSEITASTSGTGTTGAGGDLAIAADALTVAGGGSLTASATDGSEGAAGTLSAAAATIAIRGAGSEIAVRSDSPQPAGSATLAATDRLLVSTGGAIVASATGAGAAGNVNIAAPVIRLRSGGEITAETAAGRGNIAIASDDLRLQDNSRIATDATGTADGGDIAIVPLSGGGNLVVLLDDSAIRANAEDGDGGNIDITVEQIYFAIGSITASSQRGIDGNVTIANPEIDPSLGFATLPDEAEVPLLAEGCRTDAFARSSFRTFGQGGVALSPDEPPIATEIWEDLSLPAAATATAPQPAPADRDLVEAERWHRDARGRVMLVSTTAPNEDCPLAADGLQP